MKLVIDRANWSVMNSIVFSAVCISVLCQLLVGFALVLMSKNNRFDDEKQRLRMVQKNNYTTILVLLTSIINIFISIFIMSE